MSLVAWSIGDEEPLCGGAWCWGGQDKPPIMSRWWNSRDSDKDEIRNGTFPVAIGVSINGFLKPRHAADENINAADCDMLIDDTTRRQIMAISWGSVDFVISRANTIARPPRGNDLSSNFIVDVED